MKLGKHRQNCHLSTTLFLRQRIICIFAKMAYARATPASQEGYFVINRSTLLLALGLATISASAAARSNTEFESLRANIRNSGASSGSAVKALCNKYYKIAFDTKYHNVWNEKEEQICARDPSLWYSVWRAKLEIYFYNALSGRDAKIASLRRAVAQMENAKKAGYQSADVQLDKWRDLLANLISAPGVRNAAPVPRGQTVRADDRLAPQLTFGQRAEWRPPATMESVGGSGIFKVFRDRSRCESDPQKAEFYLSVPSEAAIAEHLTNFGGSVVDTGTGAHFYCEGSKEKDIWVWIIGPDGKPLRRYVFPKGERHHPIRLDAGKNVPAPQRQFANGSSRGLSPYWHNIGNGHMNALSLTRDIVNDIHHYYYWFAIEYAARCPNHVSGPSILNNTQILRKREGFGNTTNRLIGSRNIAVDARFSDTVIANFGRTSSFSKAVILREVGQLFDKNSCASAAVARVRDNLLEFGRLKTQTTR